MKEKMAICAAAALALGAGAEVLRLPPPTVRVGDLRADEKPVEIATTEEVVADNGLYCRVRTTFVFTNPNVRRMSADFEFPIPAEATVCGYALEIDGVMVPGVVVGKEAARVAFESEKARNVDPGVVEHVAGNIWRTRIFPLLPNVPRRARVDYIVPVAPAEGGAAVCAERDGGDVFVAEAIASQDAAAQPSVAAKVAAFLCGAVVWDASSSAEPHKDAWRKTLSNLPEKGEWRLFAIRDTLEPCGVYKDKAALLAAVDALVYDGGTALADAFAAGELRTAPCLLFSDELDTLGLAAPDYESLPNVCIASRPDAPAKSVRVRKLSAGEEPPAGVEVRDGTLLATAWAADRIQALSSQAEARREEFLSLGRRYGVASPVTSLIVLETLEQYKRHKIEPPSSLGFHGEWVRWRQAQDDEIAKREAGAEHERELLRLWKERVEWWNDPVPPRKTPKSGLFDTVEAEDRDDGAALGDASEEGHRAASAWMRAPQRSRGRAAAPMAAAAEMMVDTSAMNAMVGSARAEGAERSAAMEPPAPGEAGSGGASIKIKPWSPDAKYVKDVAAAADPYREYLRIKKEFGSSPAFFMDVATWFFRNAQNAADRAIARRILSNMAEFKLDDAAIWRSMGWRLREVGEYAAAVRCFRHALAKRAEEAQSRRDLALVLAEQGKAAKDPAALSEALALLREAAFADFPRRSARRSNDLQVAIVSLEELNALAAWCRAAGVNASIPQLDPAFRRDLPLKIRIVLSWDADETDIDIHVLEPDGEEAYYGHRRTSTGGFVGEDVTTGYGPEEYLRKEGVGKFKVLANYFASHQTALTGAVTATATVYTDWGTAAEQMKILTLRLDKPKDKYLVGEVEVEGR